MELIDDRVVTLKTQYRNDYPTANSSLKNTAIKSSL